jgi:hypothetical protein
VKDTIILTQKEERNLIFWKWKVYGSIKIIIETNVFHNYHKHAFGDRVTTGINTPHYL